MVKGIEVYDFTLTTVVNLDTYFAASMFHKLFLTALACIVTVNVVPGFQSAVAFIKLVTADSLSYGLRGSVR